MPHFPGSTGFGLEFMDAVRGDGCGSADLAGVLAAGHYARTLLLEAPPGVAVDGSRGVAVAGHSWGGYLALLAATRSTAFSCAVASASICDWASQQARTEVRYYDRFIMGGWVYEDAVAARAAKASPDPSGLAAPTLLLHGRADADVPFCQAEAFARAAPPDLLEAAFFEGEPHGMGSWSEAAQATWCAAVAGFLKKHTARWDFTDNPHGDLAAY